MGSDQLGWYLLGGDPEAIHNSDEAIKMNLRAEIKRLEDLILEADSHAYSDKAAGIVGNEADAIRERRKRG